MRDSGKPQSGRKSLSIAVFNPIYHTNHLNPWPNPIASRHRWFGYRWLSACPGEMKALFKDHPSIVWQASETSHSKSSLGNFQHQYLTKLLLNVLLLLQLSCDCEKCIWKVIFCNSVTCYNYTVPDNIFLYTWVTHLHLSGLCTYLICICETLFTHITVSLYHVPNSILQTSDLWLQNDFVLPQIAVTVMSTNHVHHLQS